MRDTLGPGFSSPGPDLAWAHPSSTLITPIGISFLDLSAHLAISINVHPIINKAQLGFANQLVFQTICLQTVQLASNIPKGKVKGKHVTQTTQHGSLLPARKSWYSPPKMSAPFFLLFDGSQFNIGTKIYCLISVILPHTDSQLPPCFWVFLHTATRII